MAQTFIDLSVQAKAASVTNPILAAGAVLDANIGAAAAIQFSKLAALPSTNLLIGSVGNVATAVAMSGDASISNAGLLTIANAAVTGAKIASATITGANIAAATVTDANLVIPYLKADGTRSLAGSMSAGGFSITSLASPVNPGDASTKGYVDTLVQGITWKGSVRLATTTALPANVYANGASGVGATLTGSVSGAFPAIDSVAANVGDRVLVKNEAAPADNGIYTLTSSGSSTSVYVLTRATDYNTAADDVAGTAMFITEGTVSANMGYTQITTGAITVGTTALLFSLFTGLGQVSAGNGITKTGNTISVYNGNGLTFSGSALTLLLADTTLTNSLSGLKLAALPSTQILVGNASNVASAVSVSGDATLSNTGALTISAGAIVDSKVSAAAAIQFSKLAALPSANILVGSALNVATAVAMSGQGSLSNAGALTVNNFTIAAQSIGSVLYFNGSSWVPLAAGSANQFFRVNSGANAPEWGNFVDAEKFAANGSTTAFTLAHAPQPVGSEKVYLNGVLMDGGAGNDYTISGAVITFLFTPTSGSKVMASYRY